MNDAKELVAPFWKSIAKKELRITKCDDCLEWVWPPRSYCRMCKSSALSWIRVDGVGSLYTWITVAHSFEDATNDEVPFVLAIVELSDAKVRVLAPMRTSFDPEIGTTCELYFEPFGDLAVAPIWRIEDAYGGPRDKLSSTQ